MPTEVPPNMMDLNKLHHYVFDPIASRYACDLVTAESLRLRLAEEIKDLQETCIHEKAEWMEHQWAPGHGFGAQVLVCSVCEWVMEERPPRIITKPKPMAGGFPT